MLIPGVETDLTGFLRVIDSFVDNQKKSKNSIDTNICSLYIHSRA